MTPKTTINMHPKVFTSLLIGLGIVVLGAVVDYITPQSFDFLGVWAGPAFSLFTVLASLAGGWLKKAETTDQTIDAGMATDGAPSVITSAAPTASPAADSSLTTAAQQPTVTADSLTGEPVPVVIPAADPTTTPATES